MLHIQLEHFPEKVWRFNLTEQQLYAIVLVPWARGQTVELGEHLWRPGETKITVIEGPHLPVGRLTLGRGWSTANREGKDVTAAVLENFKQRLAAANVGAAANAAAASSGLAAGVAAVPNGSGAGGAAPGAISTALGATGGATASRPADDAIVADAFGLDLLRVLGDGPLSLNGAWRLAGERHPELQASGSLELAMKAVASLLASRLATLTGVEPDAPEIPPGELESRVRDMDGWLADSGAAALQIKRA